MPFFGGQQIYKAVGSNIIGGVNTLVTNEGDNNIGIGNSVLSSIVDSSGMIFVGNEAGQNLSEENNPSDDVIAIGKAALKNADYVRDAIFIGLNAGDNIQNSEADIAIGLTALRNANNGVAELQGYNIAIGYECMESTQRATQNIALGIGVMSNATRADRNIVLGDNSGDNWNFALENIVIGNLSFIGDAFTPSNSEYNIVIGTNIDTNNDSGSGGVQNRILIGNNIINAIDNTIIIGDPNVTYTEILIGGVDLLNIGGGFGAQATQDDPESVSISSSASDGVSGYGGNYFLNADTDSTTYASAAYGFTAITPTAEINHNVTYENLTDTQELISNNELGLTQSNSLATIQNTAATSLTNASSAQGVKSGVDSTLTEAFILTESTDSETSGSYYGNSSISTMAGTISATFEMNHQVNGGQASNGFSASTNFEGNTAFTSIGVTNNGIESISLLAVEADIFSVTAPADTGAEAAPNYAVANAPVAGLTVTNYLAVTFNGVAGYIPFLSA